MLNGKKSKIAYLIGAGGTHANIKAVNGTTGLLMRDLLPLLAAEVRELVSSGKRYMPLADFVNELVDDVDFEHMITFFDESPSAVHRDFAGALRRVFERVLKQELAQAKRDLGQDRLGLYSALLDMYNVDGISERLQGILTLNYDDYIEDAAKAVYGAEVDFGVGVDQEPNRGLSVLKLHGSFGWSDVWPIRTGKRIGRPLWIPPGIRKAKDRYPFNLVWGLAREVLDCDILRVVGCRLGPSDWDLISLLFSTRHSNQCRDESLCCGDHRFAATRQAVEGRLSVFGRALGPGDRHVRGRKESDLGTGGRIQALPRLDAGRGREPAQSIRLRGRDEEKLVSALARANGRGSPT